METILTVAAVQAAHLLKHSPESLEWLMGAADRYVDWRGKTLVCRSIFGARFSCDMADIIQRKIAYFGVWEPNLTAYLQRTLKPGHVFIDVGANIGYYSLLASALVGDPGKVVAIDASPAIFEALTENIRRNHKSNIRAVNMAVDYAPGELSVFLGPRGNIGKTSTSPSRENVFEAKIEAAPLHDILAPEECFSARLIKVDTEGGEGGFVNSFLENIPLYSPDCELAIEVSPGCEWIPARMREAGFFAYEIANDYSDRDYVRPAPTPPLRSNGKLDRQRDFIFSRIDADSL